MTTGLDRVGTSEPQSMSGLTNAEFIIPIWAKKTTVVFSGVSSVGGAGFLIQLGDAYTGYETSGYLGSVALLVGVNNYPTVGTGLSSGFTPTTNMASNSIIHGAVTIYSGGGGNKYVATGLLSHSDLGAIYSFAGSKTMTTYPMEKIKVTFAYSDTFDAGTVHTIYEG